MCWCNTGMQHRHMLNVIVRQPTYFWYGLHSEADSAAHMYLVNRGLKHTSTDLQHPYAQVMHRRDMKSDLP